MHEIFETNDYSLFKRLKGNRPVKRERIDDIKRSIQAVGYLDSPLIVNENLEIIDGQGRFEACKELGLPILYTISQGAGAKECLAMNSVAKRWVLDDYIRLHAENGNPHYLALLEYVDQYPALSETLIAMAIYDGIIRGRRNRIQDALRDGAFVADKSDQSVDCLKFMNEAVVELKRRGVNTTEFFRVLVELYKGNFIDPARMLRAIKNYSYLLTGVHKRTDVLDQLQEIYNKSRKPEYFRDAFLMSGGGA